jgi:hypothetical protein
MRTSSLRSACTLAVLIALGIMAACSFGPSVYNGPDPPFYPPEASTGSGGDAGGSGEGGSGDDSAAGEGGSGGDAPSTDDGSGGGGDSTTTDDGGSGDSGSGLDGTVG